MAKDNKFWKGDIHTGGWAEIMPEPEGPKDERWVKADPNEELPVVTPATPCLGEPGWITCTSGNEGKRPGQQPTEGDAAYAWRVIAFALSIVGDRHAKAFMKAAVEGNGDTLKEWPEFMQGDERAIPF